MIRYSRAAWSEETLKEAVSADINDSKSINFVSKQHGTLRKALQQCIKEIAKKIKLNLLSHCPVLYGEFFKTFKIKVASLSYKIDLVMLQFTT